MLIIATSRVERYILKGVTDALFLVLETSTFRIAIENKRRGDALGSVVYAHPKCAGGLVPSRTL